MKREPGRTIKEMKETVKVLLAACQMILGNKVLNWPNTDYVRFATLADLTSKALKQNPTRENYMALVVEWGKFFKSIVDRTPVEALKAAGLKLYEQAIDPYRKWFPESEVKQ
jgi:hypothetical protein